MKPKMLSYLLDGRGIRFFGPGPFSLLTKVRTTGSLSGAAKAMGMSYTKATHIVQRAENALGLTLTERTIGGVKGGSSELTRAAEELLGRYELWATGSSEASERSFKTAFAGMADIPKLGCVVMASGEARRFGRQKLLEPLCGRSVLFRTLDALGSDRIEVVVASRWEEVRQACEARGVRSACPAGPLQSDTIHCGMQALGDRAAYLFVQGDQPLLRSSSVDALLDAFALDPRCVVRLSWQGRQGSPVLFPWEFAGCLQALKGDVGGGEIVRRNPDFAALLHSVEASSAFELEDVDTPEDLYRMEQEYKEARRGDLLS
jgi:molybdate transport repressor ModE-like protein